MSCEVPLFNLRSIIFDSVAQQQFDPTNVNTFKVEERLLSVQIDARGCIAGAKPLKVKDSALPKGISIIVSSGMDLLVRTEGNDIVVLGHARPGKDFDNLVKRIRQNGS